jgi:pfkB family carbohydrate kinase
VLDTTGAGDAFTVAFAHAVLSGFSLPRAVAYANIAGAIAALSVGAQGALLRHQEILTRLEAREVEKAAKVAAKLTRSGKRVKPKEPPKPVPVEIAPKPESNVAAPKPVSNVAAPKPVSNVAAPKPVSIKPVPTEQGILEVAPAPEPEEPKKRGRKRAG